MIHFHRFPLALALAALGSLAACGGGSSAGSNPVGPCAADVHGCAPADYMNLTGGTATITFTNFAYSPKCATVKVGQAVTFEGDFSVHPIVQTCGPVDEINQPSGGGPLVVTFSEAGSYGYWCGAHHALGMTGAIEVVP